MPLLGASTHLLPLGGLAAADADSDGEWDGAGLALAVLLAPAVDEPAAVVADGDSPPQPVRASAAAAATANGVARCLISPMGAERSPTGEPGTAGRHRPRPPGLTGIRGTAVSGPQGAGRVTGVGNRHVSAGKVPPRACPGHVCRRPTVRLREEITPKAFVALGRAP